MPIGDGTRYYDPRIINSRESAHLSPGLAADSRYRTRARRRRRRFNKQVSRFFSLQLCVDMYNLGNYIASPVSVRMCPPGGARTTRQRGIHVSFRAPITQLIGTDCYLSSVNHERRRAKRKRTFLRHCSADIAHSYVPPRRSASSREEARPRRFS